MVSKVLLACIAITANASTKWYDIDKSYTFDSYLAEFGKVYSNKEEYAKRQDIFASALEDIMAHNKDSLNTYKKGVNQFTDLTSDEFGARLGYRKEVAAAMKEEAGSNVIGRYGVPAPVSRKEADDLPKFVDWRGQGVLSPVKDQGHCGSCWAFASTAMVESYVALATPAPHTLFDLSPQQLVACAPNSDHCGGVGGCEGSIAELAFDYVTDHGMTSEFKMSYTSYTGPSCPHTVIPGGSSNSSSGLDPSCVCTYDAASQAEVGIEGHVKLPANDYAAVMTALRDHGPLAVNVAATGWHAYEGGIFPASDCNADINHVVQLVGYGEEAGEGGDVSGYWIVRNSWGPVFGENGFIRLERALPGEGGGESAVCATDSSPSDGTGCSGGPEEVEVCGACGVIYDASYPLGAYIGKPKAEMATF